MASPPANQPPRSAGKVLLVVALLAAMVIAAGIFSIYVGFRILSQSISVHAVKSIGARSRQVDIHTPGGGGQLSRASSADVGLVGLPVYPGATRVKQNHGNAKLAARFQNKRQSSVIAAEFKTPDPLSKVAGFYKNCLNGQLDAIRKPSRNKTVLEIKAPGLEKVVTLKRAEGVTRIELIKILHGKISAN